MDQHDRIKAGSKSEPRAHASNLLTTFIFKGPAMPSAARRLLILLAAALSSSAYAAPTRPQLKVTAYVIHAELQPAASKLIATAQVTFTALEDLTTPSFELNNGLTLTSVTDGSNKQLPSERLSTQNAIRFTLANAIPRGTSSTWTFAYSGVLTGSDTSPVEGIKLAAIADPISILLYPGRWFPMSPQWPLHRPLHGGDAHSRPVG